MVIAAMALFGAACQSEENVNVDTAGGDTEILTDTSVTMSTTDTSATGYTATDTTATDMTTTSTTDTGMTGTTTSGTASTTYP